MTNKITQGDCFTLLRKVPPRSIDLIFADPPYFLPKNKFYNAAGEERVRGEWDMGGTNMDNYRFQAEWLKLCRPLLKDTGSLWVSGTYHSIYHCGFSLLDQKWMILNEITWYKRNAMPNRACVRFCASHENLIWASPNQDKKYKFNYKTMKGFYSRDDQLKGIGMQMRSVWDIPIVGNKDKKFGYHPTQKPEKLLDRIILACTDKGDVVLDPFSGSGTTAVSALKNERKYICFEKDPKYIELSKRRLNAIYEQNTLF